MTSHVQVAIAVWQWDAPLGEAAAKNGARLKTSA